MLRFPIRESGCPELQGFEGAGIQGNSAAGTRWRLILPELQAAACKVDVGPLQFADSVKPRARFEGQHNEGQEQAASGLAAL